MEGRTTEPFFRCHFQPQESPRYCCAACSICHKYSVVLWSLVGYDCLPSIISHPPPSSGGLVVWRKAWECYFSIYFHGVFHITRARGGGVLVPHKLKRLNGLRFITEICVAGQDDSLPCHRHYITPVNLLALRFSLNAGTQPKKLLLLTLR